jgi:hypothetical protein
MTPEDIDIQMTRAERRTLACQILERLSAFSADVEGVVGAAGAGGLAEITALYGRLTANDGLTEVPVSEVLLTRRGMQDGIYYLEAIVKAWHKLFDDLLSPEKKDEAYAIHKDGYDVFVSGGYQTRSGGGGK